MQADDPQLATEDRGAANTNGNGSLRLFFALWPDPDTRARLQELQASMRGRIIPYENLHLTLAFLGPQPANLVPALTGMLADLRPLEIALDLNRIGYFPRKRIAWAGMRNAPESLHEVRNTLIDSLQRETISFDTRNNFKPHVTLARDASLPPDLVFDPIAWNATEVALVQSSTQASGAIYRVLASRSLARPVFTRNVASGNAGALS